MLKPPSHILITGASSGIGAELAITYAREDVVLALTGRNALRLEEVAISCRARGAQVIMTAIDVRDALSLKHFIEQFDDAYPVDLVIANAGVSATTSGGTNEIEQAQIVFDINLQGVLNTVHPLIPRMMKRRAGQIAMMSSLASFRPLPSAPPYSASKAAVRYYGEALAGVLKHHGIVVSVICPGWIHTPLTDKNTFAMPFIMSSKSAAQHVMRAISCGKRRIIFPKRLYFLMRLLEVFPISFTNVFFDEKHKTL